MIDDLGVPLFQEISICSMYGMFTYIWVIFGQMLVDIPAPCSIWEGWPVATGQQIENSGKAFFYFLAYEVECLADSRSTQCGNLNIWLEKTWDIVSCDVDRNTNDEAMDIDLGISRDIKLFDKANCFNV